MSETWEWRLHNEAYEGWWPEGAHAFLSPEDVVAAVSREYPDVYHRFAASEDMLQFLKDLNNNGFDIDTKKGARIRELIARAEGKNNE